MRKLVGSSPIWATKIFSMNKGITLDQYKEMLNKHNWYYSLSDDQSVYNKGYDDEAKLRELTINNNQFLEEFNLKAKERNDFIMS